MYKRQFRDAAYNGIYLFCSLKIAVQGRAYLLEGLKGGAPPVGKTQARNPTDKPEVGWGPVREGGGCEDRVAIFAGEDRFRY